MYLLLGLGKLISTMRRMHIVSRGKVGLLIFNTYNDLNEQRETEHGMALRVPKHHLVYNDSSLRNRRAVLKFKLKLVTLISLHLLHLSLLTWFNWCQLHFHTSLIKFNHINHSPYRDTTSLVACALIIHVRCAHSSNLKEQDTPQNSWVE